MTILGSAESRQTAHGPDRRRSLAVAEDVQRITELAQELQRNAVELEGQSRKLRDTLEALSAANEALDRTASAIAAAQSTAEAATARLARLQSITAALSNSTTPDAVAERVLGEAMIALECDSAAVVIVAPAAGEPLTLLRESGSLDALMRSFDEMSADHGRSPYDEVIESRHAIYLESAAGAIERYPGFRDAPGVGSRGAWIFLPLEIGGEAVGALAFGFADARAFAVLDRQFADTVARYCAQALDRVRLRVAAAAALAVAKEARQMAEHANSAKTVFLRGMSHELRTPLNAIGGYAALLEDGIRGSVNAEQANDLGRIRRASAYLLRLINDILTVARLEGARPLHLMSIAVNPVLVEVEALCAIQARASGLTLTVTTAEPAVVVTADAERLQQIVLNLVTNAIKFTARGGTIDVTCSAEAGVARIDVRDSGVGVRQADIDRVFEAFVQIDPHLTSPAQQGVGLGLSISRELARGMKGDVTIESVEGVGSTFSLTLPIAT
jgi:signal transduction histidine kinase